MKLLIFTYAPAGLGHLRVTDALVDSRPKNTKYVLLGSMDKFLTWGHRFTSVNPLGKFVFVRSQYGLFEDVMTKLYRILLKLTSGEIYRQLTKIILDNADTDDVWVVATHFEMAHQIGYVKEKLARATNRKIRLIVQVTDDTSQHIWCVPGADLTFVPSLFVQKEFENYAREQKIEFHSEVIPYPLSSTLIKKISKDLGPRNKAFSESGNMEKINIAIPISGAAVGLGYFSRLIKELRQISDRFEFWVVVKRTPFTELFIASLSGNEGINLLVGKNDIQMIELYELLYDTHLIHLEITKPSEQSFKAIICPDSVGGSILLFTTPIGRQEEENIKFLERHDLIMGTKEVLTPRAIRISPNPTMAAKFILWATETGLFSRMTAASYKFSEKCLESGELGADGAKLFWEKAEEKLGKI